MHFLISLLFSECFSVAHMAAFYPRVRSVSKHTLTLFIRSKKQRGQFMRFLTCKFQINIRIFKMCYTHSLKALNQWILRIDAASNSLCIHEIRASILVPVREVKECEEKPNPNERVEGWKRSKSSFHIHYLIRELSPADLSGVRACSWSMYLHMLGGIIDTSNED